MWFCCLRLNSRVVGRRRARRGHGRGRVRGSRRGLRAPALVSRRGAASSRRRVTSHSHPHSYYPLYTSSTANMTRQSIRAQVLGTVWRKRQRRGQAKTRKRLFYRVDWASWLRLIVRASSGKGTSTLVDRSPASLLSNPITRWQHIERALYLFVSPTIFFRILCEKELRR